MVDIGVPPAVGDLLGMGGKTWRDRTGPAIYTSPTKKRNRFQYEDISRGFDLRGSVFSFPRVNEDYVQKRGFGSRQYPSRCIFSGPDCDRQATVFEACLMEPGIGSLELPLYGKIPNVVPFGRVERVDPLKTAANQAIVEVTFWTTLAKVYPNSSKNAKNEILAALDAFDAAAANAFADGTDLTSALSKANAKGTIKSLLRDVRGALSDVSGQVASVRREFDDGVRLINEGIDTLIGTPLLLAQQIVNLIKAPARAIAGIRSRLEGYADLARRIFGSKAGRPGDFPVGVSASAITRRKNDMYIADLFAMAAVSGSVVAALEFEFQSKPDAITAAEEVASQFDDLVEWRDQGQADAEIVDTGEAYQALQEAAALTAGFLIDVSFRLVPERILMLDRPRTIIDLASELYGNVDDATLNKLINSNKLTGSECLEVPRGRRILYYPG